MPSSSNTGSFLDADPNFGVDLTIDLAVSFGFGAEYGLAPALMLLLPRMAGFLCVCISDVTFFKPVGINKLDSDIAFRHNTQLVFNSFLSILRVRSLGISSKIMINILCKCHALPSSFLNVGKLLLPIR